MAAACRRTLKRVVDGAGAARFNVYLAQIDITPTEGDATQWRWRFFIDSPGLAAPCLA
jgi:hypothetical protein